MCIVHNIVCPYLTYYNENRDAILDKGGEKRNDLKIEFLKMVNSDFKRTYKDPFMKAFDKELKNIQKQIVGQECYEDIIKCIPKNKNNWHGSAINHIL